MTQIPQRTVSIALTDDEIVALSVRLGADWPSPLPSMVNADEAGVQAAVLRGWRSLSVRDLVVDGAPTSDLVQILQPALRRAIAARTFPASAEGAVPTGGTFLTAYSTDGQDLLLEVTSGPGIHVFESRSADEVRTLVTQALDDVFANGIEVPAEWPAAATRPNSLCLRSGSTGHDLAFVVAQGSIRFLQLEQQQQTELRPAPENIAAVVNAMLDQGADAVSVAGELHG